VPKDSIRRFLNHSGGDIIDHYIRNTALGELQLAEQETISAHIIKALGSPRSLSRWKAATMIRLKRPHSKLAVRDLKTG
jgi:hypothetical protein